MTTTWTAVEERIAWTATEDPSYQFVTLRPTTVTLESGGGGGVELGETSSTAYRGDRGKTAYDHSQVVTGNPHGTTADDLGALVDPGGSNDEIMQRKAGNWTHRTPAQVVADMGVTSKPGRTIMAASRWDGSGNFIGTVLGPGGDNNRLNTMAVPAGHQIFWHGTHTGQTITAMYISVSATSLSAGQSVHIACYAEAADGGPGVRQWVQSITVGTSTGAVGATSLSLAMPNGKCWISFLNPSGNAGSVTVRRCDFTESEVFTPAGPTIAFQHMTGMSASSADLSATKFSATASSTVMGANTYSTFPLIGVQA